jgi:DNA-binding CsgD family transcriptional regulator
MEHGMVRQDDANIWQAMMPRLIESIGSPNFMSALDEALRTVCTIDLTCAFAYAPTSHPLLLHNGMQSVYSAEVMLRYLAGTYHLDCVYTACKSSKPAGLYRLTEIAPDAFFEGEYYNSPEVHPCISMESGSLAEEIIFLVPLESGAYVAHSLMRQNGNQVFTSTEFENLKSIEPQARALMAKHFAGLKFENHTVTHVPTPEEEPGLDPVFRSFCKNVLTPRERMIVSYMLRGHSSLSISNILGIAEGTVKNHRKHIYAKLAISSQAELFARFVVHATGRA